MASEYYEKKFQDVKPDEKVEMTKKERRINWWHYNWGKVALVVVLCVTIGYLISDLFFRTHPDYDVAYVGTHAMSIDKEELEAALAQFGEDVNGDGEVVVRFNKYLLDESDAMYESYEISMLGDMDLCVSEIFIIDDPEWFCEKYNILDGADIYQWSQCPALSDIKLGGRFCVARRTYKVASYAEDNAHADGMWEKMIEGVQ